MSTKIERIIDGEYMMHVVPKINAIIDKMNAIEVDSSGVHVGSTPPESLSSLWIDSTVGELKNYDTPSGTWIPIELGYMKPSTVGKVSPTNGGMWYEVL